MIKILQMNSGTKEFGGVSSFVYEIYKRIDKDRIQFDFYSPGCSTYKIYEAEINKMGGSLIEKPIINNKIIKYFHNFFLILNFLKKNNYDIVHVNSGNIFFNVTASLAAKLAKTSVVIVHSHNSNSSAGIKKYIERNVKKILTLSTDVFLACSKKAGENMFSRNIVESKMQVIPNGIDLTRFKFSQNERSRIRQELGLEDKYILGHIGRFNKQKNHMFLIDIFDQVKKEVPNSVLILIGDGMDKQKIKSRVSELGIEDSVLFLGIRKDVHLFYSVFDVFLLPSLYEGLPIVGVESQASGLPMLVSDQITRELSLTNLVNYLPIDEGTDIWTSEIKKNSRFKDSTSRTQTFEEIKKSQYSIEDTVDKLTYIYERTYYEKNI
ncbi:glycosyltransferase family 1 protein [Vagococcus lutrae]|uniref:glycosyltransferase family 1 protein n=1 Tax=Vagococcus lutrae TaxID=81947 RepID=UPI0023A969A2|nr:glycosyltransferase family 1 protein [Vagococcus lutrae]WEB81768.1 glycosyltransferase family 1 protein [Vagococcus lutrae]